MPTFTVKNLGRVNSWKDGRFTDYWVSADDGTEEHWCYTTRKPTSPAPAIGDTIFGHIEERTTKNGKTNKKLVKDQQPDGSGNQGSSGGTFNASRYERQPMTKDDYWGNKDKRDVESQARMGRAHAQEMALRFLAIGAQLDAGRDVEIPSGEELMKAVPDLIDWFHKDVQRFPLDVDLGGGNGTDAPLAPAADVSAEASPQLKGKATQLMNKAGLAGGARKALILFRCGTLKDPPRDRVQELIDDLTAGATAELLLAEIWDAHRSGNNPLATRASKLIPADVPLAEDPNEKAKEYENETGVPF